MEHSKLKHIEATIDADAHPQTTQGTERNKTCWFSIFSIIYFIKHRGKMTELRVISPVKNAILENWTQFSNFLFFILWMETWTDKRYTDPPHHCVSVSFLCYTFLNNLCKNNRNSIWIQLILFSKRDTQQIKMFNLNCLLSSPVCLITGNDKRETLWSIVSDCALLFNWFSILLWETLWKGGEGLWERLGK